MPKPPPNIVLFTTDQHRGDCVGLAGHPVVETPNLDSWINRGAYFPNAYTEIPSTTGARRVLLSGKGSYDCGLIGYSASEWFEPNTLADVLTRNGYQCINVGWRNLHPRRKLYGFHTVIPHDLQWGDDDYWEWLTRELGPYAHERSHGCDANGFLARPWPLEERYHPSAWTTAACVDQLSRRDPTKPVFLWCSHLRPHSPYDPPKHFWDLYIDRDLPPIPVGDWAGIHDVPVAHPEQTVWRGRLSDQINQRMRAGYYGCITQLDYELGHLAQRLGRGRDRELVDNALWIFVSDHGDMMSDHHLHRKSYAYEGSTRIPFVIRYPVGLELPTGAFDHPVGLQDVMPTILECCGIEMPEGMTGQSVFGAIRGQTWRDFIHGEHSPCYDPDNAMHYVTDGKTKYVYFPTIGQEQLFDLVNDRQELNDLAGSSEHADLLETWRQRLVKILGRRKDDFSDGRQLLRREPGYSPVVQGHPANVSAD